MPSSPWKPQNTPQHPVCKGDIGVEVIAVATVMLSIRDYKENSLLCYIMKPKMCFIYYLTKQIGKKAIAYIEVYDIYRTPLLMIIATMFNRTLGNAGHINHGTFYWHLINYRNTTTSATILRRFFKQPLPLFYICKNIVV